MTTAPALQTVAVRICHLLNYTDGGFDARPITDRSFIMERETESGRLGISALHAAVAILGVRYSVEVRDFELVVTILKES